MHRPPHRLTQLLSAAGDGDASAQEELWSVVYSELRGIARHQMVADANDRTLQPTALVHEAWFRLFGDGRGHFANRRHFFSVAAKAMRHIRIDDVRKRNRLKRGGALERGAPEDEPAIFDQDPAEVLAVHEALVRLEAEDPRKAEVVMLRYFAGLTEDESAAALGVSRRTIQNDWRLARAWLYAELSKGDTGVSERDQEA